MPVKKKIFVVGATGYIGGTVLQRLRRHPSAPTSEITVLVRNAAKLPLFASIDIKTVFGTLDDAELLEQQASESDVVFACADSDHVTSCEAILRGLKKRHHQTDTIPAFVHTSGTDVMNDGADGMYSTKDIWDDMDLEQIKRLPITDPPRLTDLLVLEADKQGYARTHVVLPSTVYDVATGPLVDLGVQHARSIEIPKLVRVGIARGRAGMVGLGLNVWSNVHVDDLGDLYAVLYDAILAGRAGHGREGLYFGENGQASTRMMAEQIGAAFVEFGACPPEFKTPTSFDEVDYSQPENEQLKELYGANSHCKASRARTLGWRPKHGTDDMLQSIRGEVEWQLVRRKSGSC